LTGCKTYGFVGGLTGTASIMTLTAIAVDRYHVIAFPLHPHKRCTAKKACVIIVCVWLYSLLFSSLPLFGLNNYVPEGYLTSCSFDYLSTSLSSRVFVFVFFVAAWLLPVSLIVYSYMRIYFIVRHAERTDLFSQEGGRTRESFKCK